MFICTVTKMNSHNETYMQDRQQGHISSTNMCPITKFTTESDHGTTFQHFPKHRVETLRHHFNAHLVVRSAQLDGEYEIEAEKESNVGVCRPLHVWHRRHFPRRRTVKLNKMSDS